MASPSTVLKCLNEFSMNFNRKNDYVDTMAARWCKAFEATPDKALIAAVQAVCERTFTYPPTLGDVVGATKKAVADMLGHRDSGKGLKRYQFCDECRERKGLVSTAAHYIWTAPDCDVTGKKHGEYYVSCKDNLCGCPDSKEYRGEDLRIWSIRRQKLRDDPRLELITWQGKEGFFFTCSEQPYLKGVDRQGRFFDYTCDLNEFTDRQNRIEARRRGDLPSTPFSRAVDIMISGNVQAISALMDGDGRSIPVETTRQVDRYEYRDPYEDDYVTSEDLDWGE